MTDAPATPSPAPVDAAAELPSPITVSATNSLVHWLKREGCSLAFTSYKRGRLFLLGVTQQGELYCRQELYRRATGLHLDGGDLYLGTVRQLWRLANTVAPGKTVRGFDALYHPRQAWTIGEIDVHELGLDGTGRPIFCATQYSCLATTHPVHAFQPVWKPPFVSDLVPEDRCHLNGLAFEAGKPRYITALGATDTGDGWRATKADGGVVVDVPVGKVVVEGLSMPHSPRLHDGALWLAESGRGRIVRADPATGEKTDVAFMPGFLRGLDFHAGFGVTTLSLPRGDRSFAGLPLQSELETRGLEPRCGVALFDLKTGAVAGGVMVEGADELFDVRILPGVTAPGSVPPNPPEDHVAVSFEKEFAAL